MREIVTVTYWCTYRTKNLEFYGSIPSNHCTTDIELLLRVYLESTIEKIAKV
jgi:hypothetical protein